MPGHGGCIAFRPGHDDGITLTRGAPEPLPEVPEPAASVFAFEQNARAPSFAIRQRTRAHACRVAPMLAGSVIDRRVLVTSNA
jgi:hypothetical protein